MGLYIVSCEANPIQRDISGQEHGATEQARDVWNAVVNHDLQQVKDLLSDENINTYHPDDGKNTLLLKALWENEADIADYLIQQGASPYGQNILGITPLFIAINKGHSDISKVLITYGANVNIKGPYGITPLLYACLQGDQEVARLLIEHGAFVDDADQSGNTPLIWASHYAHSGIIEKLLEYGACTETLHNENSTPLLSTSRMYMYTSYLENLSSYQLSEPEFQCVQQAFGKDPLKIIKLLIAYGANVDAVGGEEGETPLISAISPHCEDLVRLLLESGADVNKRDNNSQTPLCKACKFGHREIVRTLIMFGADVNAKSEENNVTPLFIASGRGYEDIVRLLIEHGASVDEPGGGDGQTSLIAASQQGKNAIVHLLLENCARVDGESNIILGPHHMGHEVCRYLINTVVPAIHSAQVDLFEQQPDDKKEGYLRIALGRGCFQMAQNIAHQIQDQHYRARGVLAFLQSPLKGTQWLRGFVQSRNIGMQDLLQVHVFKIGLLILLLYAILYVHIAMACEVYFLSRLRKMPLPSITHHAEAIWCMIWLGVVSSTDWMTCSFSI